MANSDARGVRRVRCPKCHSLLQEPSGVPVYQCGGCGATLRAKNRSGDTQDVPSSASPSRSGLPPPQSSHLGSGDVASTGRSSAPTPPDSSERHATGSTSRYGSGDLVPARKHGSSDVASTSSTPDVTSSRRQATDTRSRRESGDLVSTSKRVSEHVPATEKKEHDQSTNRGAYDSSEFRRQRRGTDDAEHSAVSPGVSVNFPGGAKDARISELQVDTERRTKGQAESPDAARKKHSGEAAVQPQFRDREELAPKSAQAAESQPSRNAAAAAAAAATRVKVPSPPRHELQAEDLAPLRQKILKTVDELKGDLSELFSKSPNLNPTKRARPPRLPKQEGYASRGAVASTLPDRARRAAAVMNHHGSAARAVKPGHQVAAAPTSRGLPSRRYRRCRADPCCDNNVQSRSCHHGKPECSSCRGHCGRSTRAHQEPSAPRKPPAAKEAKRRPPPRHHCRPVLKGAPFIVCSTCFKLVQLPADFAVSTNRLRKLRCGSCSAVLSYSYRDPARKKLQDSIDQFSTDGSEVHDGKRYAQPDPFEPFVDDFGLSSYSTEDEHPLHVSRNTSLDTVDGVKGAGRLHRLMGYGSASELLRHSPDLYESFDERTTPDYDRKGKGVCIDAEDDDDFDDSDDEDSGELKRSAARGAGWPLPGMLGKGVPGPGVIRIKS